MEPVGAVDAYHSIDPITGFLATTGNYPAAFDGEKKKAFLEVYKAESLGIRKACRRLGISTATIGHHLQIDPEFKDAFDNAEREYIEDLECTSRINALNPKSVIERIFQLKCLLPSKYGQENKQQEVKVNLTINGDLLIDAKRRSEIVDVSIARETDKARLELGGNPA